MSRHSMYETTSGKMKKRMGVVLDVKQYEKFVNIAEKDGKNIQDYTRQLIDMIIASKI